MGSRTVVSTLALSSLLVIGVSQGKGCQQYPPHMPVLDPEGVEITLEPAETRTITAKAEGAERWRWMLVGEGELNGNLSGPAILYTAPAQGGSTDVLTVTALNKYGESPSSSITLRSIAREKITLSRLNVIPAGWMTGEGSPGDHIIKEPLSGDHCGGEPSCMAFTYREGGGWAGVLWWPVACGDQGSKASFDNVRSGSCGINVPLAANFEQVKQLSFGVRGENGGEVIQFGIGGSGGYPRTQRTAEDSPLTIDWEERSINLGGLDLSNATLLFSWIASDGANPEGARFYLRNIRFEGVPVSP